MRRPLALAVIALAGAALVACGTEPLEAHPPIVAEAPWTGPERLHYNLLEREGLEGTCVLETEPEVTPGVTEVRRFCRDAEEGRYEDNGSARVDSVTLGPISSLRVVVDQEEGDSRHFATTYARGEGLVRFASKQFEEGGEEPSDSLDVQRELPEPTKAVPEPAWYDDEELLWLVRAIPLTEGFEGSFTNVNASTGRVFAADVTVERREVVEVPAGTFATWKIRLETSTVTQLIWVEQDAPHRVIRARIERLTYELTAFEE